MLAQKVDVCIALVSNTLHALCLAPTAPAPPRPDPTRLSLCLQKEWEGMQAACYGKEVPLASLDPLEQMFVHYLGFCNIQFIAFKATPWMQASVFHVHVSFSFHVQKLPQVRPQAIAPASLPATSTSSHPAPVAESKGSRQQHSAPTRMHTTVMLQAAYHTPFSLFTYVSVLVADC